MVIVKKLGDIYDVDTKNGMNMKHETKANVKSVYKDVVSECMLL